MKTLTEIYNSLTLNFYNKTKLDVQPGTAIDSYMLASSKGLVDAYTEIDNNKNPYFITNSVGTDLDSMGVLLRCARIANETDDSYRYRLINWPSSNEAANQIAISVALTNLTYASTTEYVPYTEGVGTASIYIIPKTYDDTTMANAVAEVKTRLANVLSPSSYINYIVPTMIPVRVVAFVGTKEGDLSLIKTELETSIKTYINSIATKDYLEVGEINKIGVNETGVNYFSTMQLYINGYVTSDLEAIQKQGTKFIFQDIIWWEVTL